MELYGQNLHIEDEAFGSMRQDANVVLQRLIKNMVEKESLEGKVTISIDISLAKDVIPNRDPKIEGDTRVVLSPKFEHKVSSVMQIKSEQKGNRNYAGMELVYDSEIGEYVMKPIANTDQMTIYDVEYTEVEVVGEDGNPVEEDDSPTLEGKRVLALPGGYENEDEVIDVEVAETEADEDAEAEDMSEEFEDGENPLPFDVDDDYEYEEPNDEY